MSLFSSKQIKTMGARKPSRTEGPAGRRLRKARTTRQPNRCCECHYSRALHINLDHAPSSRMAMVWGATRIGGFGGIVPVCSSSPAKSSSSGSMLSRRGAVLMAALSASVATAGVAHAGSRSKGASTQLPGGLTQPWTMGGMGVSSSPRSLCQRPPPPTALDAAAEAALPLSSLPDGAANAAPAGAGGVTLGQRTVVHFVRHGEGCVVRVCVVMMRGVR